MDSSLVNYKEQLDFAINTSDWVNLERLVESVEVYLPTISQAQKHVLRLQYLSEWWKPLNIGRILLERRSPKYLQFVIDSFSDSKFKSLFLRDFAPPIDKPSELEAELAAEYLAPPFVQKNAHWVVIASDEPLGFISLCDIDFRHRKAELLVGFPGESRSLTSVGSTLMLIEHAFSRLGIEKLYSFVHVDNELSQKSTESLGFQNEGILQGEFLERSTGRRLSLYRNGLLASDFESSDRIKNLLSRLRHRKVAASR